MTAKTVRVKNNNKAQAYSFDPSLIPLPCRFRLVPIDAHRVAHAGSKKILHRTAAWFFEGARAILNGIGRRSDLNSEAARHSVASGAGKVAQAVQASIGLEQEFMLAPCGAHMMRPDLQMAGRTVIGIDAPRGQEMRDHYMAPSSSSNPALNGMRESQNKCYRIGTPLRTHHREGPHQYEFAPLVGSIATQIDRTVIAMQVIQEVAAKHGMAALLQEEPFNNVNGSGSHTNWFIATVNGVGLLNVDQIAKDSGSIVLFPVIMHALIAAVDTHGDLMRLAIATPGNDFRLGACEAPPTIISTYLDDDMTTT